MFTPRKLRSSLALVFLFIVIFISAVFLVTRFFVTDSESTSNISENSNSRTDFLFPSFIPIGKDGKFLSVAHQPNLIPLKKKDYLLFFWFNLKSLPAIGDRLVLLSKYVGAPPRIKGFAIGLSRDSNSLRPVLFWGDGSNAGRWHDFPEISLATNEWNLFAMHVHKDRFVGMYSARVTGENSSTVKFLGGHEITLEDPLNIGEADIVFGSPQGRGFKGKIGPLAIINPFSIGFEELPAIIASYVKSPGKFSILGDSSEYQLLIQDGRIDSSSNKNSVVTSY